MQILRLLVFASDSWSACTCLIPYGTSWPAVYGTPVDGVVSANGLRITSSSTYSTFGLRCRPCRATVGTSIAIAFMLKISCLTVPLAAATADLMLAADPGLKATITRVVPGAADTLPENATASAATHSPRAGTIFDARVYF